MNPYPQYPAVHPRTPPHHGYPQQPPAGYAVQRPVYPSPSAYRTQPPSVPLQNPVRTAYPPLPRWLPQSAPGPVPTVQLRQPYTGRAQVPQQAPYHSNYVQPPPQPLQQPMPPHQLPMNRFPSLQPQPQPQPQPMPPPMQSYGQPPSPQRRQLPPQAYNLPPANVPARAPSTSPTRRPLPVPTGPPRLPIQTPSPSNATPPRPFPPSAPVAAPVQPDTSANSANTPTGWQLHGSGHTTVTLPVSPVKAGKRPLPPRPTPPEAPAIASPSTAATIPPPPKLPDSIKLPSTIPTSSFPSRVADVKRSESSGAILDKPKRRPLPTSPSGTPDLSAISQFSGIKLPQRSNTLPILGSKDKPKEVSAPFKVQLKDIPKPLKEAPLAKAEKIPETIPEESVASESEAEDKEDAKSEEATSSAGSSDESSSPPATPSVVAGSVDPLITSTEEHSTLGDPEPTIVRPPSRVARVKEVAEVTPTAGPRESATPAPEVVKAEVVTVPFIAPSLIAKLDRTLPSHGIHPEDDLDEEDEEEPSPPPRYEAATNHSQRPFGGRPNTQPQQSMAFRLAAMAFEEERMHTSNAPPPVPTPVRQSRPVSTPSSRPANGVDDTPRASRQMDRHATPASRSVSPVKRSHPSPTPTSAPLPHPVKPAPPARRNPPPERHAHAHAAPPPPIPQFTFNGIPSEDSDEEEDMPNEGPSFSITPAMPVINVTSSQTPSFNISGPDDNPTEQPISGSPKKFQKKDLSSLPPVIRKGGLICGGCGKGIVGRIVSAIGVRWHPECFKCSLCSEALEHVSSYEHEGRPFCHLDYHEQFAPRCFHCETSIIDERFITLDDPALGKRMYHEQHFFCAECGDPFLDPKKDPNEESDDVGFTVYKGHPYCEACHVRLRMPKCKKCNKSIREGMPAVEALGGKWCWACFVCAGCDKPFDNPAFFERAKKPFCESCFGIIIKSEL